MLIQETRFSTADVIADSGAALAWHDWLLDQGEWENEFLRDYGSSGIRLSEWTQANLMTRWGEAHYRTRVGELDFWECLAVALTAHRSRTGWEYRAGGGHFYRFPERGTVAVALAGKRADGTVALDVARVPLGAILPRWGEVWPELGLVEGRLEKTAGIEGILAAWAEGR